MVGVCKTVGYRFVVIFGTSTLESPSLCMFLGYEDFQAHWHAYDYCCDVKGGRLEDRIIET